jgi:hypothetical protein
MSPSRVWGRITRWAIPRCDVCCLTPVAVELGRGPGEEPAHDIDGGRRHAVYLGGASTHIQGVCELCSDQKPGRKSEFWEAPKEVSSNVLSRYPWCIPSPAYTL